MLGLGGIAKPGEGVGPVVLEEPTQVGHGLLARPIEAARAVLALVHELGLLQHPQVLGHRGAADVEVGRDVTRRTLRIPHQSQDLASAGLGEGFQGSVHAISVIENLRKRQPTFCGPSVTVG